MSDLAYQMASAYRGDGICPWWGTCPDSERQWNWVVERLKQGARDRDSLVCAFTSPDLTPDTAPPGFLSVGRTTWTIAAWARVADAFEAITADRE